MKNSLIKNLLIFFVVIMFIASVFSLYNIQTEKPTVVDMRTVMEQVSADAVAKIIVEGDNLAVELKDGAKQTARKETGESLSSLFSNYGLDKEKMRQVPIEYREPSGFGYWFGGLLPFLVPLFFVVIFIWFMMRQVQGANTKAMSFGQSRARKVGGNDKNRITFANVAGVKEAKQELLEVVDFLKNPKKFTNLGAKIPKGVLLMGSPGTGKTLLAKAVAGEAGVPFYSISGSEFVEMFVGVGASRVRDLFKTAKKNSPCIVFIDEIDAVGRQRGAGLGGSHDEREQTLNQILVEMDGFDPSVNVIVMAATNRPDVLDPALLRPGRFDRRVVLDMPDINDREAILTVHAQKIPLEKEVEIRRVAERTPGFSGADLANVLNEAAILAARQDKKKVSQSDLLDSIEKVMLGPERKSHVMSKEEKKLTAAHEAGHALVSHLLPASDPVRKVSIISRGRAAGYTLQLPSQDKYMHKRSEFIADLAVLLAGYTTEKVIYGEVTTGASNDLSKAAELARDLVTRYGMSEKLAPRLYGGKDEMVFLGRDFHDQKNYSEKIAEEIDREIDGLVREAENTARKLILENRAKLDEIVDALLAKETLEQAEFEQLVGPKPKA